MGYTCKSNFHSAIFKFQCVGCLKIKVTANVLNVSGRVREGGGGGGGEATRCFCFVGTVIRWMLLLMLILTLIWLAAISRP